MMNEMKKKFAIGVAVTLLALPLSTTLTLADTATSSPTTTTSTPALDTSVPTTVTPATTTTSATTTSSAITGTVVDSSGSTVTPANWFTDLIGKLQLMLTFDPARKAELSEQHALANLAEAQKFLKEDKTDEAQVAINKYTDKITMAQGFLTEVKDSNSDAAKNLVIALSKVNTNNIQVLSSLLDKLPPQAAQKLALNIVRSMEKAVTKMDKENGQVAPVATTINPTTPSPSTTTTTPVTTSATTGTSVADAKMLEKQAKIALESFKKSLKKKKISVEDQTSTPQAQSTPQTQPTVAPVNPVNPPTAPIVTRSTEQNKEGMREQAENGNGKGKEKEEGNHRDK